MAPVESQNRTKHRFHHGDGAFKVLSPDVFQHILQTLSFESLVKMLETGGTIRDKGGTVTAEALALRGSIEQIACDVLLRDRPEKRERVGPIMSPQGMEKAVSDIKLLHEDVLAEAEEDMWYPLHAALVPLDNEPGTLARARELLPVIAKWPPLTQDRAVEVLAAQLTKRQTRQKLDAAEVAASLDDLLALELPQPEVTLARLHRELNWIQSSLDAPNQALISTFLRETDARRDGGRAAALLGLTKVIDLVGAPDGHVEPPDPSRNLRLGIGLRAMAELTQGVQATDAELESLNWVMNRLRVPEAPVYAPKQRKLELFREITTRLPQLQVHDDTKRLLMLQLSNCLNHFEGQNRVEAIDLLLAIEIPNPPVTFAQLTENFNWTEASGDARKLALLNDLLHVTDQRKDRFQALAMLANCIPSINAQASDARERTLEGQRLYVFNEIASRVAAWQGPSPEEKCLHQMLGLCLDCFPTRRDEAEAILRTVTSPSQLFGGTDDSRG